MEDVEDQVPTPPCPQCGSLHWVGLHTLQPGVSERERVDCSFIWKATRID